MIPIPGGTPASRGLARAALALDGYACQQIIRDTMEKRGVIWSWDHLLVPVLTGVGQRWETSGRGSTLSTFSATPSTRPSPSVPVNSRSRKTPDSCCSPARMRRPTSCRCGLFLRAWLNDESDAECSEPASHRKRCCSRFVEPGRRLSSSGPKSPGRRRRRHWRTRPRSVLLRLWWREAPAGVAPRHREWVGPPISPRP